MSQIDNEALDTGCEFYFQTSLTPVATAGSSTVEQSFTLTGIPSPKFKITDNVFVSDIRGPAASHVVMTMARINATGQLVIAYTNPNTAPQTYPAGLIQVVVVRLPLGTPTL